MGGFTLGAAGELLKKSAEKVIETKAEQTIEKVVDHAIDAFKEGTPPRGVCDDTVFQGGANVSHDLDDVYRARTWWMHGPGTVAEGHWPAGATNEKHDLYGTYKMTSNSVDAAGKVVEDGGEVKRFLNSPQGQEWAPYFKDGMGNDLKPGSPEFKEKWKWAGENLPEDFYNAQYQYEIQDKFVPKIEEVENATGLTVRDRSMALQNVVFCASMEPDPQGRDIVIEGLRNKSAELGVPVNELSDEKCMEGIIDERMKYATDDQATDLNRERDLADDMRSKDLQEMGKPGEDLQGSAKSPQGETQSGAASDQTGDQSDASGDKNKNKKKQHTGGGYQDDVQGEY